MMYLKGIGIKEKVRVPLMSANHAIIDLENGIVGDVRGKGGDDRARQVTLISYDQWEEVCKDLGVKPAQLSWMERRANLCICGVRFTKEYVGKYIKIGQDVKLFVTGETTPCKRMEAAYPGLRAALVPEMRGGVTCRVMQPGRISTGNPVTIEG